MSREGQILSLTGTVVGIARGLHEVHGGDLQELINDGWVGAILAVDRYDPDNLQGANLHTFAKHRIRGEILDGVRARDHLTVHHRRQVRAGAASAPQAALSIDRLSADGLGLEALLPDDSASAAIESRVGEIDIDQALRSLPPRSAFVIREHYLAGRSLTALAGVLGITTGRACQLAKEGRSILAERLANAF